VAELFARSDLIHRKCSLPRPDCSAARPAQVVESQEAVPA
jgi:hypothetical protein